MNNYWIDLCEKEQIPFLYRCAYNRMIGERICWQKGAVTTALFSYLEGSPEPVSETYIREHADNHFWVCLSKQWENYFQSEYPNAIRQIRYDMGHLARFHLDVKCPIPAEFTLRPFDAEAFALHPFSHGENYSDYEEFCMNGIGAVVWHGDEIVTSASSFLYHKGMIELDVSTVDDYQRKGLASACVKKMLTECQERRISVHWDAQNPESKKLAEKFGFQMQRVYPVYIIENK